MYRPWSRDVELNGKILWECEQRILWLLNGLQTYEYEQRGCFLSPAVTQNGQEAQDRGLRSSGM